MSRFRVVPPQQQCRQIETEGAYTGRKALYNLTKKGYFEVNDTLDAKTMIQAGCFPAGTSAVSVGKPGFWCPNCEFQSLFTVCGRCHEPLSGMFPRTLETGLTYEEYIQRRAREAATS